MTRRKQLDLRAKLVRDTETFLNRALEYEPDNPAVSPASLIRIIDVFSQRVSRLVKLKSLRSRRQRRTRTGGA